MNLPDFVKIKYFINLRKTMGAKLINNWNQSLNWKKTNLDQILKTTGQEINPEEIYINDDGTLEYEGYRVLVYIRDARNYSQYGNVNKDSLPKFHLAWCKTLEQMKQRGRYDKRYVVTKRDDGLFFVNVEHNNNITEGERELYVCKNCLRKLNYPKGREDFNIKEFFNKYKETQIDNIPLFNEYDAPKDEYPKDWDQISYEYRKQQNWICENCGRNMKNNKSNFHVHHVNGNRSDCRYINLKALCLDCHSLEPFHDHMKSSR